jgi:hypothetical protein
MTFKLLVQEFAVFIRHPGIVQFEIVELWLRQFFWAWTKDVFYAQVDTESSVVTV